MKKATKNLLTRDECRKELLRSTKSDICLYTFLLIFFIILCVPLILAIASLVDNLPIKIIIILLLSVMPCILVTTLICAFIELRLINRGGFSIVKDTVCRLVHNEEVRFRRQHNLANVKYEDAIYFSKYGRL